MQLLQTESRHLAAGKTARKGRVRAQLPKDFFGRAHAMTREHDVVERVVDQIESLEGEAWTAAWMNQARRWERRAREVQGQTQVEADALRRACAYYSLAAYPYLKDDYRRWAYRRVRELYVRACELEGAPVQVVQFPFRGRQLKAYVRRSPQHPGMQPLVLLIRGLDSTKEVTYWDERWLLQRGYAVASIDFPGMGENRCAVTRDAEQQFCALLDTLGPGGRHAAMAIDTHRTLTWGLGFGGYWAFKLAAVDERVKTAINIGGPIHHAFSASLWRYLRHYREVSFLKEVFQEALGPEFRESLPRYARGLSLVRNGLLADLRKPLLYINGDQDLAVSSREAGVVRQLRPKDAGPRRVELIKEGGHLAIEKIESDVLPLCLAWIETQVPADVSSA